MVRMQLFLSVAQVFKIWHQIASFLAIPLRTDIHPLLPIHIGIGEMEMVQPIPIPPIKCIPAQEITMFILLFIQTPVVQIPPVRH